MSTKFLVSMVVDSLPEHYYKAELLIFSLQELGKIPAENIIIQYLNRVDEKFKDFVDKSGCKFREIGPYLDGTYCNKLQQLDQLSNFFQNQPNIEGILLLDVDMVVVTELKLPRYDKILGKVVDGPNPPLPVLERIFSTAQIELPDAVLCDWGTGPTLSTNFNGGFYYIPASHVKLISERWRYWATWLHERPELFDTPRQRIHIDQISMAMTLSSESMEFVTISANYNFPIHQNNIPRSFDVDKPVFVLHYHHKIDDYGLIELPLIKLDRIVNSLNEVNKSISEQEFFVFYDGFKRKKLCQLMPISKPDFAILKSTISALKLVTEPRRRLIFHGGTLKTGTSSLQTFLHENRSELCQQHGLLYPSNYGQRNDPKHQWMVNALNTGDERYFSEHIRQSLEEVDSSVKTIFLSAEGISNHWWDAKPESKLMFSSLKEWFDVEVWIWFRNSEDFAASLYCQYLINPPIKRIPCYCADYSFDQMMTDPWFARHLDYLGLVRDLQGFFGELSVHPFEYSGDTIGDFKRMMCIDKANEYLVREKLRVSSTGVEFLRIINRHTHNFESKAEAVNLVKQLEILLKTNNSPFQLNEIHRLQVKKISALGNRVLNDDFDMKLA